MKQRMICLCMLIALLVAMLPRASLISSATEMSKSGTCGDTLQWTLDDSGTLSISGIGPMYDYESFGQPWCSHSDNITNVIIRNGVTTIGDHAFHSCDSLTSVTIPNSVTTIGDYAFSFCDNLTSLTIPNSVTTIGGFAFYSCYNLTGIHVDQNNPKYSSDSAGILFDKDGTTLIQAPGAISGSYAIPDSVTTIGDWAFNYCDSLTSVTIPNSVAAIGDYAFEYCFSLSSVTIPDSVATIGDYTFHSCDSLTSLIIPDSVTTIGDYAFHSCDSLTSVTIPNSVTTIGDWSFGYCDSLSNVTILDSVTTIGYFAFYGCDSLTDVYYGGTEERWNQISVGDNNDALTSAAIHFNINDFSVPIEGSSAVANADDIHAYRDVLTMYYTSISCNWSNCDGEGGEDVGDPDNACYIISKYESQRSLEEVGYCLLDINADGQSELIISMLDIPGIDIFPELYTGTFYDLYTIVDGDVIHVVSAGERNMYNLAEDYSINNSGSGGAAYSIDANCRLDSADGSLKVNQAVIFDGWKDSENPYFYTTADCDVLIPISNDEAAVLLDSFPENKALKLTPFDEYNPSASAESAYEDYARTEWIEQHMAYAFSDEYGDEIVAGFSGSLNDLFADIRDDNTIKAYSTLNSVNQILSFDLDLSETQEYELLLAQIFFSYIGEDAIEEIYAESMTKVVIMLGEELLNLDDFKEIGDSDQLEAILKALKSAEGVEGMNAACDSFFNFVDAYDNIDIKTHLAENIGKESFNLVWDVAIDSLDLVTTTLKELTMYVAVGEAYAQTSDAFGKVLLAMRRKIGISSDNPNFNPIGTQNLVTDDVIWKLIGTNDSPFIDPLNTPVVLKDLATAIEDFYTSIETYKNEDSSYIAQIAIADLKDGAVNDVLINNGANAAVSLFSCLPVVREYKIIKDVLATGQAVIDLLTDVDEREYLGTMLLRLYCISYLHYLSVDGIAGTPESWNTVSIDLDNYTPGTIFNTTDQDLYESQFRRATTFDEAIKVYKSISVVAADYALEYVDIFLIDAVSELAAYDNGDFFDQFLKNRDDLVQSVAQYTNTLKLLERQKADIQAIACHDGDLRYDSVTNEITYSFEDSRIYIVACPVDVIVTTDTGEQIAYLSGENNQVAEGYEFYFHTIKLNDDSGEYIKVAIVPDGYQVELVGTDDGTMNAFVTDFTSGDVGEVETYFNIPIEKDSVGYFEVSSENTNESSLVMDRVAYFNMESAEDIPTDSESNGVWIWIVGGTIACGIFLVVILKKKSRK